MINYTGYLVAYKMINSIDAENIQNHMIEVIQLQGFGCKSHCYCGPLLQSTTDISLSAKFSFSLSFSLTLSHQFQILLYTKHCNAIAHIVQTLNYNSQYICQSLHSVTHSLQSVTPVSQSFPEKERSFAKIDMQ